MSEGDRQRSLAAAHEAEAAIARHKAEAHDKGDEGERRLLQVLEPLRTQGWVILPKRHWPGTTAGDLDVLLIGPGGLVVLDSKAWSGRISMAAGRLRCSQVDCTGDVEQVAEQVHAVEGALREERLTPGLVTGALVVVGQTIRPTVAGRVQVLGDGDVLRWLRGLGVRLSADHVALLAARVMLHVPPHEPPVVIVPAARGGPRPRSAEAPALFALHELDLSELERAAQLGIEDWMVFLHPAQLQAVRARNSGPSRIRGPAGSGKSVVALHRAAYLLSQEPGELLFTTYVKTLPRVLGNLFQRLAPQHATRATFTGTHGLAMDVLREAGVDARLDQSAADTAFSLAWSRVGRAALGAVDVPVHYWQEELLAVIKARGLQDPEDYVGLSRTGRRTRLSALQRESVWDLYVRYQSLLEERGVRDLPDVVALALDVATRGQARTYRFGVVDEAQDLDLLSLRLVAALVPEQQDGLTLVGDGQQAVYAGGCTLKEAGIAVTGRSTVLRINYRNTRQVLSAAAEVVRGDDYDDLEGLAVAGESPEEVVREGAAVCRVSAQDAASADAALVRRLLEDEAAGLSGASAAVLCRTKRDAAGIAVRLRRAGVRFLPLEDYDGRPVDAVKVGTAKRAKGLEFSRVYLPRADAWSVADGSAEPERVQRERRELFVR